MQSDNKMRSKNHSCNTSCYKNMGLDFILFFISPIFLYQIAGAARLIEEETFIVLSMALATTGLSYIAAFAFLGSYTAFDLRQRFNIIGPAYLVVTIYWLILKVSDIADGHGEGNILVTLFGLIVSGAIIWKRINNTNQLPRTC